MSVGVVWHDESGWCIRAGADTHTGYHLPHNDDFVWVDSELPLVLVLDGLGRAGAERGGRAIAEAMRDRVRAGHTAGEQPETLLTAAFRSGHQAVLRLRDNPDYRNLAATALVAWVQDGRVHLAWLGTAQAWRLSAGQLERLKRPHTARDELVGMNRQQADDNLIKNAIVRYLGRWDHAHELEVVSFTPLRGDRLVLATDGVARFTPDSTILNTCQIISDSTTCAEAINEHALLHHSRDNCSCAVLAFEWAADEPPLAPTEPELPEPAPPAHKWWQLWR